MSGDATSEGDAILRVEALHVRYGQREALRDVNATFRARRITALVGPSGCGKTSFLNALNRLTDLIPGCRVSGKVVFEGRNILNGPTNPTLLRRRIGMIFQKPNPFAKSVRENIHLALREHGMRDRAQRDAVTERCLRDVGLWDEVRDRLGDSALELSGGQQQRLCLARVIALDPSVLLMDEPCSALDPLAAGVVEDLIRRLRQRFTILIVTHNLAQARRLADETAVFWHRSGAGRLIEAGPTIEVFSAPQEPETQGYVRGERG